MDDASESWDDMVDRMIAAGWMHPMQRHVRKFDASGVFVLTAIHLKGGTKFLWMGTASDGMCTGCWSSEPLLMAGELPPGRVDNADDYDAIAWAAFADDFEKPWI